jgi:putative endonuclease
MSCFIYILYSANYNKYYIGQSTDPDKRLIQHNTQEKSSFTAKYRPWTIKFCLQVSDRSTAMKIEKYLKKKNKDFLNKLISNHELQNYILDRFSSTD